MKNVNIFLKLTLLTVALLSILCVSVSAAEFILRDDFEKYEANEPLPAAKFHSATRKVTVVNENGGKAALIKNADVANMTNGGRILYDMAQNPDRKLIISYDFMMPALQSSIDLFAVQESSGNVHAVQVTAGNKSVYASGCSTPIITDLQEDKWYNIQVVIDFENQKFDARSGETLITDIDFKNHVEDIKRIFSITENEYKGLYIDNVEIALLDDTALDEAVYEAKSLYVSAITGYNDGQYPESAVEMLKDKYNEVYEQFVAGVNSDELASQLNDAIDVFKGSCIDSSSADTAANHIKVTTDDVLMIENEGLSYNLNEKVSVCDKAGNIIDEQINWTVEAPVDGVTVTDGVVNITYGAGGYLKLKAETASGIYTRFTIRIVSYGTVEITECIAYDNTLIIKGQLSKKNEFNVSVDIKKPTRIREDNLAVAEDNTFVIESTVDDGKPSQEFTVRIWSDDIKELRTNYKYYGTGWRDDAIAEFNAAENDESETGIAALLEKYNFELKVNAELSSEYSDTINAYVYNAKPLADYDALKKVIKETELVLTYKDASRENIEKIISDNMDLLVENGFDSADFNSLSAAAKTQFYLAALDVEINLPITKVSDICDQLNDITDDVDAPAVVPNRPTSGGGGGGGRGTGSVSAAPKYEISPVVTEQPKTETTETKEEVLPETEPFADIDQCEWAKDAFAYMKANNIMVGYNNEVRPNDNVTRGECAKILVVAFGLELNGEGRSFADAGDAWWSSYASIASTNNIVNGYEDGSFGGDDIITREMLAVMIDRIITQKGIELYDKNVDNNFADSEEISDYAAEAVARLYKKGIINGVGNNLFAPKLSVTRAEAAKMVYGVLTEK